MSNADVCVAQALVHLATRDAVAVNHFSAFLTGILDYLADLSISQVCRPCRVLEAWLKLRSESSSDGVWESRGWVGDIGRRRCVEGGGCVEGDVYVEGTKRRGRRTKERRGRCGESGGVWDEVRGEEGVGVRETEGEREYKVTPDRCRLQLLCANKT